MQPKGVGKFCSKQFGCKERLDLFAVDALNGFYCTTLNQTQIYCGACYLLSTFFQLMAY